VPDTAPADPIERQHHLRALALARLVDGSATGSRPGRGEFLAVIDADAPGADPVVDWSIPVEIPARIVAELVGDADIHAIVVRKGVVLHAPGELNLGRDPTAEVEPDHRPAAPRLPTLAGRVVSLVDISKPRGNIFLDRIETLLRDRDVDVRRFVKPTHTRPAPTDLRHEITTHSGAVIQALAD